VGVVDKSFLRLLTDFSLAKSEIMIDSEFIYNAPICLHPQEKYLQITNFNNLGELVPYNPETVVNDFEDRVLSDGGTFEAYNCLLELLQIPFKAELIDCKENVLLDITDKVFYTSFNDINNASQIAFEIQPIENDFYYEKCFLRLNFNDDNTSFYSNGFYVTAEDENKTFRIDYKNLGYYQGISYDKLDVYQSIRLFGYFNQPSTKEAVTIYTQLNGEVRRSRPIQAIEYKYNIDLIDTFTFERLSNALNSQIVYLNGNRFQTIDNVQSEERQGKSNMFATSFKGQFNFNDTYVDTFQLIDPFDVISYFPNSIYTYFPILCNFTFNYNLTEIIYVKLWNYTTETLIANLVPTGFVNNVTNDIEMFVNTLGKYYFTLKVKNQFGEYLEITNKEKLKFEVANPDYSFIHYTNDYLTA
jgi:hypothetical protein